MVLTYSVMHHSVLTYKHEVDPFNHLSGSTYLVLLQMFCIWSILVTLTNCGCPSTSKETFLRWSSVQLNTPHDDKYMHVVFLISPTRGTMMMMAYGNLEGYRIQHTKDNGSARFVLSFVHQSFMLLYFFARLHVLTSSHRKLRTLTTRVNGRSHGLIIQVSK